MKNLKILVMLYAISSSTTPKTYNHSAAKADNDLRMMSFNILAPEIKSKGNWGPRKDLVIDLIKNYESDIVGIQEINEKQKRQINSKLWVLGYEHFGAEAFPEINPDERIIIGLKDLKHKMNVSSKISKGEQFNSVPIFYKKDKFKLLEHGTVFFNEVTQKPNAPSLLSTKRKMWKQDLYEWADKETGRQRQSYTYGKFKEWKTGKVFWVFNSSLGIKPNDKMDQAMALNKAISEKTKNIEPAFLIGNLNIGPNHAVFKNQIIKMKDIRSLAQKTYGPQGTYHALGKTLKTLDYMLTNKPELLTVRKFATPTRFDGAFPSKHYPIFFDFQLK